MRVDPLDENQIGEQVARDGSASTEIVLEHRDAGPDEIAGQLTRLSPSGWQRMCDILDE
jgi:hypothetical protein